MTGRLKYSELLIQLEDARAALLAEQRVNEELAERNAELRAALLGEAEPVPPEWRLTRTEAALARLLLRKALVTYDDALTLLSTHALSGSRSCVNTHLWALRRKLRPFGVTIETVLGAGYRIPPEQRAALRSEAA